MCKNCLKSPDLRTNQGLQLKYLKVFASGMNCSIWNHCVTAHCITRLPRKLRPWNQNPSSRIRPSKIASAPASNPHLTVRCCCCVTIKHLRSSLPAHRKANWKPQVDMEPCNCDVTQRCNGMGCISRWHLLPVCLTHATDFLWADHTTLNNVLARRRKIKQSNEKSMFLLNEPQPAIHAALRFTFVLWRNNKE